MLPITGGRAMLPITGGRAMLPIIGGQSYVANNWGGELCCQ